MRSSAGIQLRWESYLGDLRGLLRRLRQSEELTDAVLTNGSASVRCHRVVLSAACQTFHDLLKDHPGDVVLCLGGVHSDDLRALADYIYSGEVVVARRRLADFLALAAQWGVRGLEACAYGQPAEGSDAQDLTSESTAEGAAPRVLELDAPAGHASRPMEASTADSASRRKGSSRQADSDDGWEEDGPVSSPAAPFASTSGPRGRSQSAASSDSSSGEEDRRPRRPGSISSAVLSAIRPGRGSKSKVSALPSSKQSDSDVRPQASSPPDLIGKTKSSTKSHRAAKSHKATPASMPNMFACPHCPRVFVKMHFFEAHLKIQHSDNTRPEQHRLRISTGSGRVVQLAGGVLSMQLPKKKKTKASWPEEHVERKKKKRKRVMTQEERAAEAAAVVAAADAAVKAALERAAERSRATLPDPVGASGPADEPSARDVMAAPAKRARAMSPDDSNSDSSAEEVGPGDKASASLVATAPASVRQSHLSCIPLPPPPPPPPPPPSAAWPAPVTVPPPAAPAPSMPWPQPAPPLPPILPKKELPQACAPGTGGDSPRPARIVFDQDGQPLAAPPAAPESDVKPVIIPPQTERPPQKTGGDGSPAAAATQGGEERRPPRPLAGSQGAEGDAGRSTRIVFDQEGRPRPAGAPPPVGIATHVRRELSGQEEPRTAPDRDRKGRSTAGRAWQTDRDGERAGRWDRDGKWERGRRRGTVSLDRGRNSGSRGRRRSGDRGDESYYFTRDPWYDPWLRREYGAEPPRGGQIRFPDGGVAQPGRAGHGPHQGDRGRDSPGRGKLNRRGDHHRGGSGSRP